MIRQLLAGLALVAPFAAHGQQTLATCFACHGENAISSRPVTPSLAGQPAVYVIAQLALFRDGRRNVEVMQFVASRLAKEEPRSLAAALEKLPPPPAASGTDAGAYEKGRRVAAREACATCHQPDFSGIENAPRLAHQREDYLVKALGDFKKGERVGAGEPVMPSVAAALSEADIAALAHYLAHFKEPP